MNVNKIFTAYKRKDLKLIYRLELDGEENYSDRRVINKMMKLEESNHHGFAITKQQATQGKEASYLKILNLMT